MWHMIKQSSQIKCKVWDEYIYGIHVNEIIALDSKAYCTVYLSKMLHTCKHCSLCQVYII